VTSKQTLWTSDSLSVAEAAGRPHRASRRLEPGPSRDVEFADEPRVAEED